MAGKQLQTKNGRDSSDSDAHKRLLLPARTLEEW